LPQISLPADYLTNIKKLFIFAAKTMESQVIEILRVYESKGRKRIYPSWVGTFIIRWFWWIFPLRQTYKYRIEWRGSKFPTDWVEILGVPFVVVTANQMVDVRKDLTKPIVLKPNTRIKVFFEK
jgi:hypothetical protein